jgi:hypothetical protein
MSHVYRNRSDDGRTSAEMVYCKACDGFYGVPHDYSHCQDKTIRHWNSQGCACRFCREANGKPIQGTHGYFVAGRKQESTT